MRSVSIRRATSTPGAPAAIRRAPRWPREAISTLNRQEADSTGFWESAGRYASSALEKLREAHQMRIHSPVDAEKLAEEGLADLRASALAIPHPEMDWSFLDQWDNRKPELLRV